MKLLGRYLYTDEYDRMVFECPKDNKFNTRMLLSSIGFIRETLLINKKKLSADIKECGEDPDKYFTQFKQQWCLLNVKVIKYNYKGKSSKYLKLVDITLHNP